MKIDPLTSSARKALESRVPVSDAEATIALGQFFQMVLDTDGVDELRRLRDAFCLQAHGRLPIRDFSDDTEDGALQGLMSRAAKA